MNYGMVLAATAVMALVTYLPRMLPMAVIKRKIQNRFIRSFFYLGMENLKKAYNEKKRIFLRLF